MSLQIWLWVISVAGPLFGWWVSNWTGPAATFLRNLFRRLPAVPSIDIDRLIPDDPNSQLDDIARELLKTLLAAMNGKPLEAEKLSVIERVLGLLRRQAPQTP
jgi:hypothetical protein